MIRVLLVDDHPFYREGVRSLLADVTTDVVIDAEAATGEEAIAYVAEHEVDVIVMDLAMPGMGGLAAIRQITELHAGSPVLVLTMHDDESVFAALRGGATGYLVKEAGIDDLVRAIVAVSRGEAIFSPAIAKRLLGRFAAPHSSSADAFPELTQREFAVLELLADDLDVAVIARRLGLASKTVYNYVASILQKLRARDRAEAGQRARAAGLGSSG